LLTDPIFQERPPLPCGYWDNVLGFGAEVYVFMPVGGELVCYGLVQVEGFGA